MCVSLVAKWWWWRCGSLVVVVYFVCNSGSSRRLVVLVLVVESDLLISSICSSVIHISITHIRDIALYIFWSLSNLLSKCFFSLLIYVLIFDGC